ncbi:MAG: histidine kinase N-terminal 7TM domain-containing protein [Nocardioides sp.]
MLTQFALLMAAAGLTLAALAGYVAWRRDTPSGWSLAVLLVSVAWWGLAYSVELTVDDIGPKSLWGDLKYVGIATLAPAWLVFVLQYVGLGHLVTKRLLLLLAVEPVVLLTLLALPSTHDLVRHYPASVAGAELPEVEAGPVFWLHLIYVNLLLLGATALFVRRMTRLARSYRRMAVILVAAALLPWAANLLHNFDVGWFARFDLTPFAFIVTGSVLVWGVFRAGVVDLTPVARSAVVESMADAVFVLDAFGRVVDVNPAGAGLLRSTQGALVGRRLDGLLPDVPARSELTLDGDGVQRTFDVRTQALADDAGRPAGDLVVLREITERVRDRQRLQRLLAEQSRVAAALQASMVPSRLPDLPGCELASRYAPAGDGTEVGGDFFDVFPLADATWGFVLGDVSGKGAEAAAVSAEVRYTLRALADPARSPSETLREVNARLLATTEAERHCTVVHGYARTTRDGLSVTLSLAGHHPPLVVRVGGAVEMVGRLGMALGLFAEAELQDCTVELAAGDVLCLFTDGLVEARRGSEMFGAERAGDLLAGHPDATLDDLAGTLVDAARSFHGEALADDLALLLIRARPPGDATASAR